MNELVDPWHSVRVVGLRVVPRSRSAARRVRTPTEGDVESRRLHITTLGDRRFRLYGMQSNRDRYVEDVVCVRLVLIA